MKTSYKYLLAIGVWTALGLFWATRLYFSYNQNQDVVPWSVTMTWGLLDFYAWGALSPLVIYLTRKFPFRKDSWLVPTLTHVPLSVVLAAAQLYIFTVLFIPAGGLDYIMQTVNDPTIVQVWEGMLVGKLHSSVLIYWGILIATLAIDYHQRFRKEKLKTAEIESRLARAELNALKMQLHPHFLFNTLNTIASLVRENPKAAEETIIRLGDLLRTSLSGAGATEIPFREELAFIRKYLEIEMTRFSDRLTIEYDVSDEALEALTPGLILQPLVENAMKHGIAPLERDGVLRISARKMNGTLHLEVRDNGPGLASNWEDRASHRVGISNTRGRLEQLYGADHTFILSSLDPSGALATVTLPYRPANGDLE